jgi:hypothetical protein
VEKKMKRKRKKTSAKNTEWMEHFQQQLMISGRIEMLVTYPRTIDCCTGSRKIIDPH